MRLLYTLLLLLTATAALSAQTTATLSGYVRDAETREPLPYAAVSYGDQAAYADEVGFWQFTIDLRAATDSLLFTMVGYRPLRVAAGVGTVSPLRILLVPNRDLPTVEVRAPTLLAPGGSVVAADLDFLARQPTLGGERDYLKGLTLLPGISTGVEGTANLIVRGGEPEQTGLLIDGTPIYNANHLGGFLSAIPPAGVRDITVYKGGVPARYGGRLSGFIDVQLDEGSRAGATKEFSIGSATVGAAIDGPVGKRGSIQVAGRYAYPSLAVDLLTPSDFERGVRGSKFNFRIHDLIAKYATSVGKRLTTSLTYFQGGDDGILQEESGNNLTLDTYQWFNRMASLRTRYDLGNGWAVKHNAYVSRFAYDYGGDEKLIYRANERRPRDSIADFSLTTTTSSILDVGTRLSIFKQVNNRLLFEGGADLVQHRVRSASAGSAAFSSELFDLFVSLNRGLEQAYFVAYEYELLPGKLYSQGGLRFSNLTGSGTGWFAEPRLKLQYYALPKISINAGYEQHRQYLHRLQGAGSLLPNDIWVLARESAPPTSGSQTFLGISSRGSSFEWYVEGFQREMSDLVRLQFEAGDLYDVTREWSDVVYTEGSGRVRGLEAYVAGTHGKFGGALAYTLSSSTRRFPAINDGEEFPFDYDRRHDINTSITYTPSKKWEFTALFIYQTGHAITLPTASAYGIFIYDGINGFRMPAYQRLDVSIKKSWPQRPGRRTASYLQLSVYNALNRANPHQILIRPVNSTIFDPVTNTSRDVSRLGVFQTSLFPMIPSLTYGIRIGKKSNG